MWTPARLHVTINIWIWWNKGHWGSNLEMPTWDPYNGRALARQLWNRGQLQTRTAMKELWDSCRTEYRSDLQWDWTPDLFGTSPCTLRGSTPIPSPRIIRKLPFRRSANSGSAVEPEPHKDERFDPGPTVQAWRFQSIARTSAPRQANPSTILWLTR